MDDIIATRLAKVMADQSLSARGLSLKAGLKATAVRDILNGRSKSPRLETLLKLVDALAIGFYDLVPEDQVQDIISRYQLIDENLSRAALARGIFGKEATMAGAVWLPVSPPLHQRSSDGVIRRMIEKWLPGNTKGTDLSGANLAGASFIGGSLAGANLSRANLSFANFTQCDLRNVNFQDAVFYKTVFVRADLSGANLEGVDLSEAVFVEEETRNGGQSPGPS